MKIWLSDDADCGDKAVRRGLRLRFDSAVDGEVKRAHKEFAAWLRENYCFPIRVVIYVKAAKLIKANDGDMVCAACLQPDDPMAEPYIRLAVGDYNALCEERGKDNAMASLLYTMASQITYYYQWLRGMDLSDEEAERLADDCASEILDMYAETREHP